MADNALNFVELKNSNRHRILDCLRHGPRSRAELSWETGLAKSSVTTITNQMIAEGLLQETGLAEKSRRAGRTRILLDINGSFGFAVGIYLHRKQITVAAVDLKGRVLTSRSKPTEAFGSSEEAYGFIFDSVEQAIQSQGLASDRLVGVGLSSPGPLDHERGRLLEPTNFVLFNHEPIADRLRETYGCPVFLENNAVTLALYEQDYVCSQEGGTLFVVISDGIGAALLQKGTVFRGSHGIAGEIGHISVNPFGEVCPCGNRGCLEQYATLSALKKRFGFESYETVADGALAGDPDCRQVIDFLITTLGAALVSAVNMLDPDRIVLYGEYAYRADWLTQALEDYVMTHAAICKAHPVTVIPSGQQQAHAAVGAAIPALQHYFRNTAR